MGSSHVQEPALMGSVTPENQSVAIVFKLSDGVQYSLGDRCQLVIDDVVYWGQIFLRDRLMKKGIKLQGYCIKFEAATENESGAWPHPLFTSG